MPLRLGFWQEDIFLIELPVGERFQFHGEVRIQGINAFGEVDVYDAVVVDSERDAKGIQSDFEPTIEVPFEGCGKVEFQEQGKIALL